MTKSLTEHHDGKSLGLEGDRDLEADLHIIVVIIIVVVVTNIIVLIVAVTIDFYRSRISSRAVACQQQ